MWYLRKFPTIVDYETYKNNPDEFLVPGVSYVREVNSCFYDPIPKHEPEHILHPVIHAKFNATSENMMAFANTTQIKALKINGNVVDFEPPVVNTVMINALASEMTIKTDQNGSFPADYAQKCSNIVIKPTDSSLKCTDFKYIAALMTIENTQYTTVIPIDECIAAGMASYNETDDTLVVNDMASLMGADNMGAVFTHFNENTFECTPVDTTCTFTAITGGLESPYMFETEGIHEVEIEFVDNANIVGTFTQTCITEISYMKDIISIKELTFTNCDSLTSVTLGNEVTTIDRAAFSNCSSLTSITIPDSVTEIGEHAFHDCTSLTSITIPEGVTSIDSNTFHGCNRLTSINIPEGVTSIGSETFSGCKSLTSITIPEGVISIGDSAFYYCESLTSITIPDGVTEIGEHTFQYCPNLTSVDLGDGVTSIGDYAFYLCTKLTSVTIGNRVTSIGQYAFGSCTSLTEITIPDSVTTISSYAFSNCSNLAEFNSILATEDKRCIVIDGKLSAFAPAGLTSYNIPDSVTEIGQSAFHYCESLTSITIPDSVTSIGGNAFGSCTSLTEITIPNSVTSLGSYVFSVCHRLINVYCKPTTPPTGGNEMFRNNSSNRKIYVPMASVDAYKSAEYWSNYADAIEGYNF